VKAFTRRDIFGAHLLDYVKLSTVLFLLWSLLKLQGNFRPSATSWLRIEPDEMASGPQHWAYAHPESMVWYGENFRELSSAKNAGENVVRPTSSAHAD